MSAAVSAPSAAQTVRTRLGETLRGELTQRRMSQATLGKAVGVSQAQVSEWVRGTASVSIAQVLDLDRVFGRAPGYLLRQACLVPAPDTSLEGVIRADPRLGPEQVEAMLTYLAGVERKAAASAAGLLLVAGLVTAPDAEVAAQPAGDGTKELAVRLPADLHAAVKADGTEQERTVAQTIRLAVRQYLARQDALREQDQLVAAFRAEGTP